MNYSKTKTTIILALLISCIPFQLYGSTDWTLKKQFQVEDTPLDMTTSPDGKTIFFLLPGKILFYSVAENRVVDFVQVDKKMDGLTFSAKENLFILVNSKEKLVKIYKLESTARIDLTGSPIRGVENAPVTIAVYSDFQCPYCSQVEPVLAQLLAKFPKEVKIVFKNYPLSFHKFARSAATAALAAHEQGKYWEFHDRLFENYADLSEDKILEIARSLKLDMDKFKSKRVDPGIQELINRDMAEAQDNGVTGTPSLFINGKPVKDRSFEGMQGAVRAELKGI